MLSINRTYFAIHCLLVLSLLLGPSLLSFTDELALFAMLCLGVLDMLYNKSWRNYRIFFTVVGVLLFYFCYSLFFLDYNNPKAISFDLMVHLKPTVAFCITYALAPKYSAVEVKVIKWLLLLLCVINPIVLYSPYKWDIFVNPYYFSITNAFTAVYLVATADKDDLELLKKNLWLVVLILAVGCIGGRSKYFGSVVILMFMIFAYRSNIVTGVSLRNALVMLLLVFFVLFVAWQKIEYYFIDGLSNMESLDDISDTFARPLLYMVSVSVLADHLLLGSGLASYASFASGADVNYSALYANYGIDKVWGLAENDSPFIADTFYPELAQFGLVGIALFVYAAYWLCYRLRIVHRKMGSTYYAAGMGIILIMGIDATTAPGMVNMFGENMFVILGMILAQVKNVKGAEAKECLKRPLSDGRSLWLEINDELKKI